MWFKPAMTDTALDPLAAKKAETRAWFEALRDRIHSAFETLEDEASPGQRAGVPRRP